MEFVLAMLGEGVLQILGELLAAGFELMTVSKKDIGV